MAQWDRIETHEFGNIDDFVQALVVSAKGGVLFRGQGCAEWGLVPSISREKILRVGPNTQDLHFRLLEAKKRNLGDSESVSPDPAYAEVCALNSFVSACDNAGLRVAGDRPELRAELNDLWMEVITEPSHWPGDKHYRFELMAQCQHHGIPTRMLDWTRSPLVAAFFSVQQLLDDLNSAEGDQKFASLSERKISVIKLEKKSAWGHEDSFGLYKAPGSTSANIPAQQGEFTFLKGFSVPELDLLNLRWSRLFLSRFLIGADQAPNLYRKCHQLGISAASLFPGYEGAAMESKAWAQLYAMN